MDLFLYLFAGIAGVVAVCAFAYFLPQVAIFVFPVGLFLILPLFMERGLDVMAIGAGTLWIPMLAIFASRPKPGQDAWWRTAAIWILALYGLGLLYALGQAVLPGGGLLGSSAFFGGVSFFVWYAPAKRHAGDAEVLSTLDVAMKRNLPLPDTLHAAARAGNQRHHRAMRRLAEQIEQGHPLSAALAAACPACPGYAMGLIRSGESAGQLPRAFEPIIAEIDRSAADLRRGDSLRVLYLAFTFVFSLLTLAMLMAFVFPKFAEAFYGMGVELRAPLVWLATESEILQTVLPILSALVLWYLLPIIFHTRIRPRRAGRGYALSRLADAIKWYTPLYRRLERARCLERLANSLRLSLLGGLPLDRAIEGAMELDLNDRFRSAVGRWRDRVVRGEDPAAAARVAGVGPAIAYAFDTHAHRGQTLRVLETIERSCRATTQTILHVVRSLSVPAVTILIGLFVGMIAYTIFGTINDLHALVMQGPLP